MRRSVVLGGVLLLCVAVGIGCQKSGSSSAKPTQESAASTKEDAREAEITAALTTLSAEDRALATKQKVCPVSGERLGSMGAPYKVEVKGQTVFLCCEGCKDDLLATPDKFLAKIKRD